MVPHTDVAYHVGSGTMDFWVVGKGRIIYRQRVIPAGISSRRYLGYVLGFGEADCRNRLGGSHRWPLVERQQGWRPVAAEKGRGQEGTHSKLVLEGAWHWYGGGELVYTKICGGGLPTAGGTDEFWAAVLGATRMARG